MLKQSKNLLGMKFSRLTVINFDGYDMRKNGERCAMWICKCDCGTENFRVEAHSLMTGNTRSCGCLHKELAIHHSSGTRLYQTYKNMLHRCYDENNKNYPLYGARGITVCEEWKDSFNSFREWALLSGYNDKLTIERKNNDLGYSPANCEWATSYEQNNHTSRNIYITYNGCTQTVSQWAKEIGMGDNTLRARWEAWHDADKCFNTPIRKSSRIYKKKKEMLTND